MRGDLDIQARLINNAYVIADNHDIPGVSFGDLILSTLPKSGNGFWIAGFDTTTNRFGHLRVEIAVTGPGTWVLADHASAEIRINAPSTALTGDVTIHKGLFTLNADFTTTGNLEFRSIGGSAPTITLAQGVIANFD